MLHASSWILRNPDGGFGGGGEADVQTPDGASIASEPAPDYGGGEAAAAEPAPSGNIWGDEEPAAPAQQAQPGPGGFPDDHWAREYGIGSEAELRQHLAGAREASGRAQYLEKLVDKLSMARQLREEEGAQGPGPAAEKAGLDFAQLAEVMRRDPTEGYARLFDHVLTARPDLLDARMERVLGERFRPIEEERQKSALNAGYQALVAKHPEAKPGTPQYEATARWMEQNPWHGALALQRPRITPQLQQAFPDVARYLQTLDRSLHGLNLSELAFYAANFPLIQAQLGGLASRQAQAAQRSASARPGPSATRAPNDPNDIEAMVQHDIAEAQRHGTPLGPHQISELRWLYQRLGRKR